MGRFAALVAIACLAAGPVLAQGAIEQSGAVVPFHSSAWFGNGVMADAGTPQTPFISSLGLFNGVNCPFGISSQTGPGVNTNPAGLLTICQSNTQTVFTIAGVNGQSTPAVFFDIGGTYYPFPGPGSGSVVGPNSSTVGDWACWNNTAGTILNDCGAPGTFTSAINVTGTSGSKFQNTSGTGSTITLINNGGDGGLYLSRTDICATINCALYEFDWLGVNSLGTALYAGVQSVDFEDNVSGAEAAAWSQAVVSAGVALGGMPGGCVSVTPTFVVATPSPLLCNGVNYPAQIDNAGSGYAVSDVIVLSADSPGSPSYDLPATYKVLAVGGGGAVTIAQGVGSGLFPFVSPGVLPTAFSQASTTGGGTGFHIGTPVYEGFPNPPTLLPQTSLVLESRYPPNTPGALSVLQGYALMMGSNVVLTGAGQGGLIGMVVPQGFTVSQLTAAAGTGKVLNGSIAMAVDTTSSTCTGSLVGSGSYTCPVVYANASWNLIGAGSGAGTPGGSNGQIQYNNSGAFGGIATTGSGNAVLATSPTLTTPTLGVATATSIDKVAITAPATSATLAIADGKTLTASNSLALAGTDSTTMTFPASSATVAGLGIAQAWTAVQTYTNSDIRLLGSSTGYSTFASANTSATNYTLTFPAVTTAIAGLAVAQTWTAAQSLSADLKVGSNSILTGSASASLPGLVIPYGYTTSALNAATGVPTGAMAIVTDATSPTCQGPLVGGGSTMCLAFYNGAAWAIDAITTSPVVASGFGTAPSVTMSNGPYTFRVNVGTSNTGTGIVTMPAAPNAWNCTVNDITTVSATVFATRQITTGSSTTAVAVQNYSDAAATHDWTDSDVLMFQCAPN